MTYWGWIPRLTRDFYLKEENDFCTFPIPFDQANSGTLNNVLLEIYSELNGVYFGSALLSDLYLERVLNKKHKIELVPHKNTDGFDIDLLIKSPINNTIIFKRHAKIRSSGTVSYEIENNNGGDEFVYAMQMHKLIRDIFHKHVHHSTDLLLPPIKARDENEATQKILDLFLLKFVEYKAISAKARPKTAMEDFYRARGEVEYSKVFLDLNIRTLDDKKIQCYKDTLQSLSSSFDILLNRLHSRIEQSNNFLIWSLTLYVLGFTIIMSKGSVISWVPSLAMDILFAVSLCIGFYFLWNAIKGSICPQEM
jgi:hypothetical protein